MQDKKFSSIWAILFMVGSSSIIRSFLEFFSNPEIGQFFSPWYVTLNYFLCFLSIIIGIGFIIAKILNESIEKWVFIFSKYSPIIFLAPIIDLIISSGRGVCMAYLGSGGWLMGYDFVTFFGHINHCGISIGMRIEILIILIAISRIVWRKTKSLRKTVLGFITSYAFIFATGAIPGIAGIFADSGNNAGAWVINQINTSLLASAHGFIAINNSYFFSQAFSLFTARIHFLTLVILGIIILKYQYFNHLTTWIKNSRWERVMYYLFLPLVGIVTALHFFPLTIFNWVDTLSLAVGVISIITACWAAAVWNDFSDTEIDTISNSDRPLHNGIISVTAYKNYGILFFIISSIGALLINYPFFFCITLFQILYATYSYKQTRWKKHFITSGLTIGVIGTVMILAGYFFIAPTKEIIHVPLLFLINMIITIGIMAQVKDFKDIPGDRADGIKTLPVIFGARKASALLTATLVSWIFILGILYSSIIIALQALPWIVIDLVIKKKIPEYLRFLILFAQIIGLILYFA